MHAWIVRFKDNQRLKEKGKKRGLKLATLFHPLRNLLNIKGNMCPVGTYITR